MNTIHCWCCQKEIVIKYSREAFITPQKHSATFCNDLDCLKVADWNDLNYGIPEIEKQRRKNKGERIMKHYWRTDFRLVLKNGEKVSVSDEGEYFYISGRGGGTCTEYDGAKTRFERGYDFHITTGFGDGKTIVKTISHSSINYIEVIPKNELIFDTDTPENLPKNKIEENKVIEEPKFHRHISL